MTGIEVKRVSPEGVATHPDLADVEVYLMKVTPEVATELLKYNIKGQRKLSAEAVEKYAGDMATDEWVFNGAPILFDKKNQLIDGQHRLNAIMEADEAQVVVIVRGVDTDAMGTVDMNRRRSYADTIAMRGISHHADVAAIAGRNWYWFHGNYGMKSVARVAEPQFLNATPSNSQKDLWMHKVEERFQITFEHAAKFARKAVVARRGINAGTYGLAWIILTAVDRDLREAFFNEMLFEGDNKKISQPVHALQQRLGNLGARELLKKHDQLHLIFRTFNFWMAGTTMGTLNPPRPVRFDKLAMPEGWVEPTW